MLPRNAAVRFEEASIFSLDATLDGESAVLVKIPELSGVAETHGLCEAPAVRVTPAPAIGQQLVIDPHTEDEEIVELTIGEADVAPPPRLTDVFVDVHDFPTHDGCNSCGHGYGVQLWISAIGGGQDGGSPVFHSIFFNDTGDGTDGELRLTVLAEADMRVPLGVHHDWPDDHDLLGGFCVTVRTFDLARNEASTGHRVCMPCRARIEPGEDLCMGFGDIPDEPVWTGRRAGRRVHGDAGVPAAAAAAGAGAGARAGDDGRRELERHGGRELELRRGGGDGGLERR